MKPRCRSLLEKAALLMCLQAIVVALACAGTASYMRSRCKAEFTSDLPDACLLTAQAVRSRLKKEGVENRILLVEYSLNSLAWRHVAVVFTLEDGTLASYESLSSLTGLTRGSISLGVSDWDAQDIAERLPRQVGVVVRSARWIDSLTYGSTKSDLISVSQ